MSQNKGSKTLIGFGLMGIALYLYAFVSLAIDPEGSTAWGIMLGAFIIIIPTLMLLSKPSTAEHWLRTLLRLSTTFFSLCLPIMLLSIWLMKDESSSELERHIAQTIGIIIMLVCDIIALRK